MTIKINPLYIVIFVIIICMIILYFQNNELKKQLEDVKIENVQKESKQINTMDSLDSVREKIQIKRNDSLFLILSKSDSTIENKNKLQDEKIHNITISSDLLPKF